MLFFLVPSPFFLFLYGQLQDARKTAVLVVVGRSLLLPCRDRSLVAFSEMVECFLSRVNALYYPNPYHNAAHGAQVKPIKGVVFPVLESWTHAPRKPECFRGKKRAPHS